MELITCIKADHDEAIEQFDACTAPRAPPRVHRH